MKFIKDFLLLNFDQFENFGFSFPIGIFVTSMAAALCIAVFTINHHKNYTLCILKQLIRHEALDESRAKTLAELRLDGIWGLKSALSRKGQLTYMVKRVGEKTQTYDEYVAESKKKGYKEDKPDFDCAKFYIPADRIDRAKRLVETTNTEWWRPALMCLFILIFLGVIATFLPGLLDAINNSVN